MKTLIPILLIVLASCKTDLPENNFVGTYWYSPDTALMAEIGGKCVLELDFYSYDQCQQVSIQKDTDLHSGTCVYIVPGTYNTCGMCVNFKINGVTTSAVIQNDTLLVTSNGQIWRKLKICN
ncbi:MAG: hypothetical protein A2W90_14560 [Bacteroidetes bacterium GWF2_42_66]|nr:MAG: hypothetical protein A2W92_15955 [Bacteroidetes bacterium GWA2_42_15]OFX99083.1 MAG: hypothetical protein A2W89_06700 [Bacteroidetes bacterium GWE2_42_39]OFY46748.1 MAG: hypothetical protein A2W90_14560 [Bacteroidetes bacterium GWF2_42_66]HAZ00695.1 hypothetical protein [Marinilabiliales bacterium]HBL73845.1 hypothetical protein [Prolixibacteraceae bacterium]